MSDLYDYKAARRQHYRRKRLRRSAVWLVCGVVIGSLMACGLALAASRPTPAGGGRTQPVTQAVSPTLLRVVEHYTNGEAPRTLLQNCISRKRCEVFSRDGAWRIELVASHAFHSFDGWGVKLAEIPDFSAAP